MCKFKSTGRVSTINEKKQLQINILGEKSTTADTWCHNTRDKHVKQHTLWHRMFSLTSRGAHQPSGQQTAILKECRQFRINAM